MNKFKNRLTVTLGFFNSAFGSQIKYYAFFYFILWSFHLVLISLISYFHLLLNHNIRTIGDWIGDRGWFLIIISKVFIFYLALQFIRLKSKKINLVKSYFRNSIQIPRKEIIVALLFLVIGLLGLGRVSFNHTLIFELPRMIYSLVGTLLFFAIDFSLLVILEIFFPLNASFKRERKFFIFSLLFYSFTNATFIYEQTVSFKLFAYFFLLLYLGEWRRRNWTLPFLFLCVFLMPSYTLLGMDPVWSSNYSLFVMDKGISTFSLFLLIGLAILYLHRIQKYNPEYIYRE